MVDCEDGKTSGADKIKEKTNEPLGARFERAGAGSYPINRSSLKVNICEVRAIYPHLRVVTGEVIVVL